MSAYFFIAVLPSAPVLTFHPPPMHFPGGLNARWVSLNLFTREGFIVLALKMTMRYSAPFFWLCFTLFKSSDNIKCCGSMKIGAAVRDRPVLCAGH